MQLFHPKNQTEYTELVQSYPCVVVDMYSTDCPPCNRLAPIYDRAVERYASVAFLKIHRQEFRELAESFHIFSSPTVLFFHRGELQANRLAGVIEESDLHAEVERLLLKEKEASLATSETTERKSSSVE